MKSKRSRDSRDEKKGRYDIKIVVISFYNLSLVLIILQIKLFEN